LMRTILIKRDFFEMRPLTLASTSKRQRRLGSFADNYISEQQRHALAKLKHHEKVGVG
jgi:hypothetical protein